VLFEKEPCCESLLFVQEKDTYYELEPGGYRSLSIVNKSMINSQTYNDMEIQEKWRTKVKRACVANQTSMGAVQTTALKCIKTTYNMDTNMILDESSTTNCYLPLGNTDYLAYIQHVKPIGINIDLCEELTKMGVQGITVQKNR